MDIAQMEIQARCDRDETRRLREENAQLKAEVTRLAELVQKYHPAYLGLPHVVRERNEARAEVEKERAYADASNQDAIAAEAEVARLSDKCAADAASAAAEILRLEGLILDWWDGSEQPQVDGVVATVLLLEAEARRIRAKREKGEARTTCRHGVQWPDFCQFNCAIGKPAQREKEK